MSLDNGYKTEEVAATRVAADQIDATFLSSNIGKCRPNPWNCMFVSDAWDGPEAFYICGGKELSRWNCSRSPWWGVKTP